jgi:hypothetical protein
LGFGWPVFTPVFQWVETEEPLVFRRLDGGEDLIFQEDEQGKIISFVVAHDPQAVYLKKYYLDTSGFTLPLAGVCLLFFLGTIFAWLISYLSGLRRRNPGDVVFNLPRLARWLAGGFGALSLFFVAAFFGMMMDPEIIYGAPPALKPLLIIPIALVVLSVCMVGFTGLVWSRRYWTVAGRVHYTLLTLTSLAFLWWLQYWNLTFAFLKL